MHSREVDRQSRTGLIFIIYIFTYLFLPLLGRILEKEVLSTKQVKFGTN